MAWARGVIWSALLSFRWMTCQHREYLGRIIGCPEAMCPIFYPLNPLLWVVKVRVCGLEIGLCGGFREDATAAAESDIFEEESYSVRLGSGVISQAEKE